MVLFIDKVEGKSIVCEDENGEKHTLGINDVHLGFSEGSVIKPDEHGKWAVDEKLTQIRRNKIKKLRKNICKVFDRN